jgi:hypothetical protein
MPAIVIYRDNYNNVRDLLSQCQKGDLLDALMDGNCDSEDPIIQMAYNFNFSAIERTNEKYKKRCERNKKAALQRWEKERADHG